MRAGSLFIPAALLMTAASPCGLQAQPLFDAPYRWFPSYAPVNALAATPRLHRTGAFAVASHTDSMTVEIFMAEPDGDLSSTAIIPVPSHPHGVAIADFDGDGCPDVAAGGYDPPGIVLIRGRCNGKFDAPVLIPDSTSVEGLAVADFDADGHPDLVGWSREGGVVMLSDQAGGFRAPVPMPGSYPEPIAVGRIDADPYPDIGVIIYGGLPIRHGRGDGTFDGEPPVGIYTEPPLTFADLNGDGLSDVVGGYNDGDFGGYVEVQVNDGTGNLAPPSSCPGMGGEMLEWGPNLITAGDVNGDGHQDAIVLNRSGQGSALTFLFGIGCGWFSSGCRRDVQSLSPGAVADLDGDGFDDFLQPEGSGVSLFAGSASGRIGHPVLWLNDEVNQGMIAAHVDDGPTLDLVVMDGFRGEYDIEYGTGDGGFRLGKTGDTGVGNIAIADLDLDGHNDIVTNYAISAGDGQGTFTKRQDFGVVGAVGVLRSGGDPYPEVLVLASDSLIAFRNRGDMVFEPSRAWAGGGNQLVVCDLNADGRDDVIIRRGHSNLSVRLGGPDGLGPELAGTVTLGGAIQVADLDGDGRLDVFAGNATGSSSWLRGHGDGTFNPPAPFSLPPASSFVLADWNGDGTLDAAFLTHDATYRFHKVGVAFGVGGVSFSTPIWFGTGQFPRALVAGDLNGDGRPDLAVQGSHEARHGDLYGMIDLLLNNIPAGTRLGDRGTPSPRTATLALGTPSPNPLRDGTRLHLIPAAAAQVDVRVLDIAGREVRVLLHGAVRARDQWVVWDGRDGRGLKVPQGIYLVIARDGSTSITRRVAVLR